MFLYYLGHLYNKQYDFYGVEESLRRLKKYLKRANRKENKNVYNSRI